jgi:hypothetical protein
MSMTDTPIPVPSHDLDRWLATHTTKLNASLDDVLDIDAGLQDARLPALHADLTSALDDVLDIDAGLHAITPTYFPLGNPHPATGPLTGPGAGAGPSASSAAAGAGGILGARGAIGGGGFYPPMAAAGAGQDDDIEHRSKYSDQGLDLFDDLPPAYPPVFGA